MVDVARKWAGGGAEGIHFICPGCNEAHTVRTKPDSQRPRWSWNGSLSMPTLTPSVLLTDYKPSPDDNDRLNQDGTRKLIQYICHSFVTDGRIQFLSDCTHALAGQTVDLPPWRG